MARSKKSTTNIEETLSGASTLKKKGKSRKNVPTNSESTEGRLEATPSKEVGKESSGESPTKVLDKVQESTEEPVVLSPTEYFDMLKGKREEANLEELELLYENACKLMRRYTITGQKAGAMKLYNFAELCAKEIKAVKAGVTTYVNRFDLDEYISNIASKAVVIIELENYERNIPDNVIDKIATLKENEIFDDYFVVFTDYTGGERKKVEQKRRDKDPILFGVMNIGNQLNTRLYYIDSWEDEFCDLTLDKMIKEFKDSGKNTPVVDIKAKYPTKEAFAEAFDKASKNMK